MKNFDIVNGKPSPHYGGLVCMGTYYDKRKRLCHITVQRFTSFMYINMDKLNRTMPRPKGAKFRNDAPRIDPDPNKPIWKLDASGKPKVKLIKKAVKTQAVYTTEKM